MDFDVGFSERSTHHFHDFLDLNTFLQSVLHMVGCHPVRDRMMAEMRHLGTGKHQFLPYQPLSEFLVALFQATIEENMSNL